MTRMLVVALGLSAAIAAPALAADPSYKIVDRIKMSDGGWDYIVADADNGRIYRTRGDGADVIDVKTGKVSQLTSTGNGHMVVVVPGTTLGVVPLRAPPKTIRIVDTATDKIVAAAGRAGRFVGGVCSAPQHAEELVRHGLAFVALGADVGYIKLGIANERSNLERLRALPASDLRPVGHEG